MFSRPNLTCIAGLLRSPERAERHCLSPRFKHSNRRYLFALFALVVLTGLYAPDGVAQSDCNANGIADTADVDRDGDGVTDACDVCPDVANPGQRDTDGDGIGNACDPDINNDGVVGLPDLNTLRAAFGSQAGEPGFDPDTDLNGDDVVGLPDLNILRRFFGNPPGPGRIPTALVRGYIAATAGGIETPDEYIPPQDVYLPAIQVYLRNLLTNTDGEPVQTDLSGRFTLAPPYPGRYRICWRARGFISDCTETIYSVGTEPIHVSKLLIETAGKAPVIYGEVGLSDGSSVRRLAPAANINSFATVQLIDANRDVIHGTYVNNFQRYLLPAVPVQESLMVRIRSEGETRSFPLLPEANLGGAPTHNMDFRFDNAPPRVDPLVATVGGQRVQVAAPGVELELTASAQDPDGDPIRYKWLAHAGSGDLSDDSGATVGWKLPTQPGHYTVELFAYDGKGGYASTKLSIRADTLGVPFSGTVTATDLPVVANAAIEVNGVPTTSDSNGFFSVHVPEQNRYVLNIRKPGYALMSKIYNDAVTGGEWQLVRGTTVSVDPTQDIVVREDRSSRNCVGPQSFQLNWQDYPGLAQPQWQDGRGNVIAPDKEGLRVPVPGIDDLRTECGPGIQVSIPANSLVDENGQPPAGNVDVTIATMDLYSPQQMPGDFTVELPAGGTGVAQSYGVGTVDISAGATQYNLSPGATAKLEIPVDGSQLAAGGVLPPVIPILFYDEEKGLWYEDGSATLNGSVYNTTVSHFSTINTDLVKTDQSCVRVLSPSLPASYDLEVMIPMDGGAAPKIINREIDNSAPSEHVIYNLPSNINIVLTPIRSDTLVPIGNFVVNTGGPQNPTDPNLPVGPPYDACATEVVLSELVVPEAPVAGEFLHGLYTFAASNITELQAGSPADQALADDLDTASANYYNEIDPRGKRLTLGDFKTVNGFGGGEINAKFANSGDLGFGRDMHCVRNGSDVACYVTNYGNINTPDSNDIADTIADINPIATVAMEYSRIESQPGQPVEFDDPQRVVKFYVYNGNADSSTLLRNADLDDFGARPIPQLCMVCHGGEYPAPAVGGVPVFTDREHVKLGAKFLPFDVSLYTFGAAPYDKASQQDEFKDLNENIVYGTPPDAVIEEVITEMYAGGPVQDEDFSVPGWNGSALEQDMYTTTVARSCRTCHVGHVFPSLQFDDASQVIDILGQVESRVCVEHVMPHARATHDLFWTSYAPSQPGMLQIFGDFFGDAGNGWNGTLCGDFTPGGNTPVGFYVANIQPLWDGVGTGTNACTGCHTGASPPAGLSLSASGSGSYDNIFNVLSSTNAGVRLVEPGGGNAAVNGSLIYQVLQDATAPASPGRMPPFGSEMNGASIQDVEDWIFSGAPE